ncbi:MAG: UMP kinase [Phycisphaerae bacterium]|nr:UMP kinase [Phycisphaerae bacterium]
MTTPHYKRILLKVSGEGLSGTGGFGLSGDDIKIVTDQIAELHSLNVQVAVVVGAGNLIRGSELCKKMEMNRATADQMGMLATVINSLALQDVLETNKIPTRVLCAVEMNAVCERFNRRNAIRHLDQGRVIILAGGTGNPFFTTDTCASLRASEIDANVIIKATKVDGVYSADPVKNPGAKFYDQLTFNDVLEADLKIMDRSAIAQCQQNNIDIIVCNLMKKGTIKKIVQGEKAGTLITQ